MNDLRKIIKNYGKYQLDESLLPHDPVLLFAEWMAQAVKQESSEPNAMTVATVNKEGLPSARIMLLKDFGQDGFIFFTNYASRKGLELNDNPHAALVFWWPVSERQVRIEGTVTKTSSADSDDYFATRSADSRLGAIASNQSTLLPNRDALTQRYQQLKKEFKDANQIPRPDYWGGYRLKPNIIEFWQGGQHRLHDRIQYKLENENWQKVRLAP